MTRHDAAQIDDRLDIGTHPTGVVMNPPFSVITHVEGKVRDAALRHVISAFARLVDGGRLVAITGASMAPDATLWRDAFVALQQRGRVVFSCAIDGGVCAPHGTTIETRITDAATKSPIVITRHRKPRFVMMSFEHYQKIKGEADPRRVYGAGETPDDIASLFTSELDRLAKGEGYDLDH